MNFNQHITISTEERFRLLFTMLRLGGIPLCMKKIPKLYYVYRVATVISMYAFYLGVSLDIFVHETEQRETMAALRVWTAASVIMLSHIALSISRSKIEELVFFTESFIWEDLPTRDSETGYLTQAGFLKRILKILKWATAILIGIHIVQSTIRVTKYHDTIMNNVWYPFDIQSSPAYEILFFSHIFASIVCVTIGIGFMLLYSSLVVITCSQLEKLRGKLMAIKWTYPVLQDAGLESEKNTYDEESSMNQGSYCLMLNQLKDCVKFHQLIVQYMGMLENNMHLMLGGILLLNLIAMLFCAFSIVTNWGDLTDISQGVEGYLLFAVNVYLICASGDEINKEAEKVRDAAWDCDWIGAPIPFQSSVLFIIARANHEFTLTAAKFVPVSMVTFMNIMQQTLSYFMFLLEMKNRNVITEDDKPN